MDPDELKVALREMGISTTDSDVAKMFEVTKVLRARPRERAQTDVACALAPRAAGGRS